MRCFYSHSVAIYDSKQEQRDLEALKQLGFEPTNPNLPEHRKGYKNKGMDYFGGIITTCDVLAFRAHPNGDITTGVTKEIAFAQECELPSGIINRILSVNSTRSYLREIGIR